jgi:hypothetical protein
MLWHYLQTQLSATVVLFLLLLVEIGLALTIPQVIRFFIDKLQGGALSVELINAALMFLSFVLMRIFIRVVRRGLHSHL